MSIRIDAPGVFAMVVALLVVLCLGCFGVAARSAATHAPTSAVSE
jgi:hypothetical protein